jgi:drug/metabolite transporter (DMT)-like permease
MVVLAFAGVTITYLAFQWALDYATVVQVATLVTTMPIFVGLANLAINRMSFATPKVISGVCAAVGVVLLLTDGALARLSGTERSLIGLGLALVTTVLGATYAVLIRPVINEYGALRVTALSMMIGGIGLWILVGAAWGIWVNPLALFDRPDREAYSLLTIALWNTTVTQILWFGGLATVPDITRGSYLFFLKPVIAAALALTLLGQPITVIEVLAIAIICGSVLVELNWPRLSALLMHNRST